MCHNWRCFFKEGLPACRQKYLSVLQAAFEVGRNLQVVPDICPSCGHRRSSSTRTTTFRKIQITQVHLNTTHATVSHCNLRIECPSIVCGPLATLNGPIRSQKSGVWVRQYTYGEYGATPSFLGQPPSTSTSVGAPCRYSGRVAHR